MPLFVDTGSVFVERFKVKSIYQFFTHDEGSLFISYATGAGVVAAGGILGAVLSRLLSLGRNTTVQEDVIQITATAALWPIAVPIELAIVADGYINGVKWTVSVKRRTTTTVEEKQ